MGRNRVTVHSQCEIDGIRRSAEVTAAVLDELCRAVTPGMTTEELDRLAGGIIGRTGGKSAFLGYRGFPGQVCISVNDEVVHGIGCPHRVIQFRDLVSLDVGVQLDGFIGDTARTVCVGSPPTAEAAQLLAATEDSLHKGIAAARAGRRVNDISKAVEAVVQHAGFSVVRDFVGHGCGCELHEPPEVPNFAQPHSGPRLRPGMVLAIEPMVNTGTHRVRVDADGWTVRTADGGLSAHFEHMILITENEPEILTWRKTA